MRYDEDAGVVLLVGARLPGTAERELRYLRDNETCGGSRDASICRLRHRREGRCRPLYERLRKLFPERFGQPLGQPPNQPLGEALHGTSISYLQLQLQLQNEVFSRRSSVWSRGRARATGSFREQ